jgi:hypothetical protein
MFGPTCERQAVAPFDLWPFDRFVVLCLPNGYAELYHEDGRIIAVLEKGRNEWRCPRFTCAADSLGELIEYVIARLIAQGEFRPRRTFLRTVES